MNRLWHGVSTLLFPQLSNRFESHLVEQFSGTGAPVLQKIHLPVHLRSIFEYIAPMFIDSVPPFLPIN